MYFNRTLLIFIREISAATHVKCKVESIHSLGEYTHCFICGINALGS